MEPDSPTPIPAPKKRRKYTKRSPIRVKIDGKVLRGNSMAVSGHTMILFSVNGCVYINLGMAKTPVEVEGWMPPITAQEIHRAIPSNGQPVISGGIATLKKNRELEGLMALPRGMQDEDA